MQHDKVMMHYCHRVYRKCFGLEELRPQVAGLFSPHQFSVFRDQAGSFQHSQSLSLEKHRLFPSVQLSGSDTCLQRATLSARGLRARIALERALSRF